MNSLWKPGKDDVAPKKKQKPTPPKDGHDPCCIHCRNKGKCWHLCSPLKWIDGNVSRKESLFSQLPSNKEYNDYNEALCTNMDIVREKIKSVGDIRQRTVAILITNEFTIKEIAQILKCSERTVKRVNHQRKYPSS